MTIELYQNLSDNKVVDKKITLLKTFENVKLLDEFDVLRPRLKFSRETFSDLYDRCNYCFIPDFGRYYYIEKMLESNFVYLICEVDVRKSYADALRDLTCTVTRNENLKNGYLPDGSYKTLAYEQIVCKAFPNKFNNDSIILMTVG